MGERDQPRRGAALGVSTAASWRSAVEEALAAIGDTSEYNTGFLYVTDHFGDDGERIRNEIRRRTGIAHLTGTVSMAICAGEREIVDQPAVSLLLLRLPDAGVRGFSLRAANEPFAPAGDGFSVGLIHADTALAVDLIHPDKLGDVFFVGGLTASRGANLQFHHDGTIEAGATGLLLAADVPFLTSLTQGCVPIGPVHTITACEESVVVYLDDRPALDVLKDDLAGAGDWHAAARGLAVGFPLPNRDTADYVVRGVVAIDERLGLIAVAHDCAPGLQMSFMRRDPEAALRDMRRMLEDLRARQTAAPRAGVYFSCIARGANLFGHNSVETRLIREVLGSFPLTGFYCNGEISNEQVYTHTGVLNLFY